VGETAPQMPAPTLFAYGLTRRLSLGRLP